MDTIAEFLTRVRNAGHAKHEKVDIPASGVRAGIAKVLMETGYIRSYKVAKDGKQGVMRLYLKYSPEGKHAITHVERISKPSRRVYIGSDEIPRIRSGFGLTVVSTNKGIMSGDQAEKSKLGGELLFKLW